MTFELSKPSQRVTLTQPDIFFHVHPEGEYHVEDDRGAECKEGNVNEPKPDA